MSAKLVTTMACGHSFTSNADSSSASSDSGSSRASRASSSPSSVSGVQHRFINDTCAKCDPEARMRQVRQEYDFCHERLMHEYRAAKRSGDQKAMAHWEDLVMKNTRVTIGRNFEVGLVRRDPDVLFYLDDSGDEMY